MSVEKFYEKRQTPRRLLERLARLQIKEGAEFHFWLVTDIPAGGVRIHVNGFEVPEVFVPVFPEDNSDRQLQDCLAPWAKHWFGVYWRRPLT